MRADRGRYTVSVLEFVFTGILVLTTLAAGAMAVLVVSKLYKGQA